MTKRNGFVSIVDYTSTAGVAPSAIAERFARIQRDWVAMYPGFRGARFLENTEGNAVRAIIEWADEDAFKAFERSSDTEGRMAALSEAFAGLSVTGARQTFRSLLEVPPQGEGPGLRRGAEK